MGSPGLHLFGAMKFYAAQLALTFAFLRGAYASLTSLPTPSALCATPSTIPFNNSALPDPFKFDDGTPVRTVEDWSCRRAQLATLIQSYEAGFLPPKPEHLSATFSEVNGTGNLTITARNGEKSISFASPITFPSGDPPSRGWPVVIGLSGGSIPIPSGVSRMQTFEKMAIQLNTFLLRSRS